jgi:arginine metabolism regulation protein II
MDGGMSEFWIHLDGCERLQHLIPDIQSLQEPYKQLHNVCSFMTTMARSTQQDFTPVPWPDFESYEDLLAHLASPFIFDDHSLEFTYGITATLASLIHTTAKLHHHVLYYTANNLNVPDSLHTTINGHGDAITNWSLAEESFSSIHPTDCDTLAIIRHHAIAFHRAIFIHFHTLILPTSPTVIADYSQTTVENLIAAESLKRANGARYHWKSMAPVVWPGFIASCEASFKDRVLWRSWWTSVQKYRIGSITRLWVVVREVWDARDAGDLEIPGWAPILRTQGLRVISGG